MSLAEFATRAACRPMDPELWFPAGEGHGATAAQLREQTVTARAVCAGCPVRAQCLAWALDTRQQFGVWGGLTTPERRALIRDRRRTATVA